MKEKLSLARREVCEPPEQVSLDATVTKLFDQQRIANLDKGLTEIKLNYYAGVSTVKMLA
ncbi:MAG: hypothetical protein O7D30_02845 [Rickettsia endosymbiont of Ixodes persulcatus]|nr:hypothetical protein [Rickettsia endosymbiont of Ixodes persulcatus]